MVVCLSVCKDISGTTCMIFTNFSVHVPMAVAGSTSGRVTKSQREEVVLGVFFPTDIALYIVFDSHTQPAEPIDVLWDDDSGRP